MTGRTIQEHDFSFVRFSLDMKATFEVYTNHDIEQKIKQLFGQPMHQHIHLSRCLLPARCLSLSNCLEI